MVLNGNAQVRWMSTYQVFENNDRLWAFKLRQPNIVVPAYQYGDLIGIKSKCCGEPRSISYFFRESREVMFERVRWTRQSRGVFRLGTQDVTIKDCEIVRERPVGGMGWCLSTSDGGPQLERHNGGKLQMANSGTSNHRRKPLQLKPATFFSENFFSLPFSFFFF